jgi:hypothetical protein
VGVLFPSPRTGVAGHQVCHGGEASLVAAEPHLTGHRLCARIGARQANIRQAQRSHHQGALLLVGDFGVEEARLLRRRKARLTAISKCPCAPSIPRTDHDSSPRFWLATTGFVPLSIIPVITFPLSVDSLLAYLSSRATAVTRGRPHRLAEVCSTDRLGAILACTPAIKCSRAEETDVEAADQPMRVANHRTSRQEKEADYRTTWVTAGSAYRSAHQCRRIKEETR